MKFILGRKLNMTQIFDKDGVVHPATIVEATPATVTQVKTATTDGYEAVQVGSGTRKADRISNAVKGHVKDLGNFSVIREFRMTAPTQKVGDKIELTQFQPGDVIEVSAISKGKGFQGVVKRHGFGGGPRTHGQKHSEREPGSIGGGLRNKVPKLMRMAGRMGGDRITVKNLKVLHVDSATNSLYISGAVPGRRGTLVEIIG
ncbi:50S ribosomal protein L3 [bacterium]|nr:50S ribosomal protein L3 [bacterium]